MGIFLHSRTLLPGLLLTVLFVSAALISLVWVPYDTTVLNIANRMKLPSWTHLLGTDQFGRDILSMIMVGARTSIAVALVAVGIGMIIGVCRSDWLPPPVRVAGWMKSSCVPMTWCSLSRAS